MQALHKLATTRPESRCHLPYTSIQVTVCTPGEGLPCHRDGNNMTASDIIALGEYEGGLLWTASANGKQELPTGLAPLHEGDEWRTLRGSFHDINHRWLSFPGHQWHATTSSVGTRISVIFYSPVKAEQLPSSLYDELRQLGFPIPNDPQSKLAWTQEAPSYSSTSQMEEPLNVPSTSEPHVEHTVAVIAESQQIVLQPLLAQGWSVCARTHAHVCVHRVIPHDLEVFQREVETQKPSLLWIQYHGQQHPGRRAQARLLHRFFLDLVQQQLKTGTCCCGMSEF